MAIAYDFDGTLSPDTMQNYNFIPALGIKPAEFWKEVKENARINDMDEILAYLELMLNRANAAQVPIQKKDFINYGKTIKLFPGVNTWFSRINNFAEEQGVKINHYIISSGLREMITGTPIADNFENIFASGYKYDQHQVAKWPAVAVNYTTKTQYLFRINKGIHNSYDNTTINQYIPQDKRPMPFRNMIYIGDGDTDIPCMKMMKYQNGYAIAVYTKNKKNAGKKATELITHNRADFALPADYRKNSKLSKAVQNIIQIIATQNRLNHIR